jgi:hypothetical protein
MNSSDYGPLFIVISRDEVMRQDITGPLTTLKHLISNRENIRANMLNVDVSFSGYENTREELFEIPEVRNYVYALDAQFPFWLYFLSRHFMGLQCLAYCHLLPYLTPEAKTKSHPQKLVELVEERWGPALFQVCSVAGHTEAEADSLLESAMEYFASGPSKMVGQQFDEDSDAETGMLKFKAEDEHIRDQLVLACRRILSRPNLEPGEIVAIAGFIWLLQQFPLSNPEPTGRLSLVSYSNETEWSSFDLCLDDQGLTLETLESFDSGHGSDHESRLCLQVGESSRDERVDYDSIDEWLSCFLERAQDSDTKVSIEYYPSDNPSLLDEPAACFNWAALPSRND